MRGDNSHMKNPKRVCVVVVTYNRKEYLKKLLSALRKQTYPISEVLIYDNFSTDGTSDMLVGNGYINGIAEKSLIKKERGGINFVYYRNTENSGGAGGFHEGIKLALEQDCDLIWAMDDDVLPEKACLERLMAILSEDVQLCVPSRTDDKYKDYAIIDINMSNPFLYGIGQRKSKVYSKDIVGDTIEIKDMAFEGPLFTTALARKIDLPKKDLFIIFDDTEYACRASKVTELRYVKEAILHKQIIPQKDPKRLMGWKEYYGYRNQYWFDRKYGTNCFVKVLRPFLNHLDLCFRAIAKRKWSNIKVLNKAYKDGTSDRLGRLVEPGTSGSEF